MLSNVNVKGVLVLSNVKGGYVKGGSGAVQC